MKKTTAGCLSVLLALSLTACAPAAPTPTAPAPTPTAVATPTPTAAATQTPTQTPAPLAPTSAQGIIGSYYSDITVGLERFGLTEHSYSAAPDEEAKKYYDHSSSAMCENADLDANFDYSLTIDSDHQVIGASFGATTTARQSNDVFVKGAELYLKFSATMPYDAADTAAASSWVSENMIAAVDGGAPITTTIGDAVFELWGTETDGNYTSFILSINKAQ